MVFRFFIEGRVEGAEGGAKNFGVFRVKIHDFTPKKQITESPSYP
jgi:hypothetical protein